MGATSPHCRVRGMGIAFAALSACLPMAWCGVEVSDTGWKRVCGMGILPMTSHGAEVHGLEARATKNDMGKMRMLPVGG